MITPEQANKDLRGTTCAGCGGRKKVGMAIDYTCLRLLPSHMQQNLYNPVTFVRAYDEALRCISARRQTARDVGAGHHRNPRRAKFAQVKYRKT